MKTVLIVVASFLFSMNVSSQNSMVGDGFGGRLWYNPTNYTVGSYSAYSLCADICSGGDSWLYGWGANNTNQLGLGLGIIGENTPTLIPNTNGMKYFSTGYIMGGIKNDNTGWAWGGTIIGNPISVITDAKFLDASSTTISYVKNNGTVWSIGANNYSNFGDGTTTFSDTIPVQMIGVSNAVRVANCFYSTIVLLNDSTLMSTGNNNNGQLGRPLSVTDITTPESIPGLTNIIDVKATYVGIAALHSSGQVYYWGLNLTTFAPNSTPTLIPGLTNIVAISGSDDGYHFLFLDDNKNCYAIGDNSFGQCGSGGLPLSIPSPIIVATDVIDIMAGETFSYIVKSDGSLWASGLSIGSSESIWLNLPNTPRNTFTKIDPSAVAGSCELVGISFVTTPCVNTSSGTITVSNFGGVAPYSYSIGGAFQSSNVFTNVSEGNYIVVVQDANGCSYSGTTNVPDSNCNYIPPVIPPEGEIIFPNVFSPNGDNTNAYFYFPSVGLTSIDCKIYNRWGEVVYRWDEVDGKWNGKSLNGKDCTPGVYYYTVSYSIYNSENITKTGHVTLVK